MRNENLDALGRPRVQTVNDLESKTVTADAKKADINHILKQYKAVGIVDHLREVDARYMDVSEFTDYADMMRQLRTAEAEFMKLPSKVREKFNHDVATWLDAAHTPPEDLPNELFEEVAMDTDDAATVESDGGGAAV